MEMGSIRRSSALKRRERAVGSQSNVGNCFKSNTQISILLLRFLYLFAELMITMNKIDKLYLKQRQGQRRFLRDGVERIILWTFLSAWIPSLS